MSVQALGWVLDHSPAKGSDRLVLISIANHAGTSPIDGAWEAWPGIDLIQREARIARARTVNEALSRLVDAGHLVRVINAAPDERIRRDRRPNLYRIPLTNGVPCSDTRCRWCGVPESAERGAGFRPNGVPDSDRTGCRKTAPEPSVEPSVEPSLQPRGGDDTLIELIDAGEPEPFVDETVVASDRFDQHFWPTYPARDGKKVGKAKALGLWLRLTVDEQRAAVRGARNYAASGWRPKDAERWLRDRLWEDWQEPARPDTGSDPDRRSAAAIAEVTTNLPDSLEDYFDRKYGGQ